MQYRKLLQYRWIAVNFNNSYRKKHSDIAATLQCFCNVSGMLQRCCNIAGMFCIVWDVMMLTSILKLQRIYCKNIILARGLSDVQ